MTTPRSALVEVIDGPLGGRDPAVELALMAAMEPYTEIEWWELLRSQQRAVLVYAELAKIDRQACRLDKPERLRRAPKPKAET